VTWPPTTVMVAAGVVLSCQIVYLPGKPILLMPLST
jgi:hypothetical protein